MIHRYSFQTVAAVLLLTAGTAFPQDLDDEDFPPGLLAEFSQGNRSLQRIDPTVAFDWDTAAPDPRLSDQPFQVRWSGLVIVRQPGTYRLAAEVSGIVTVTVDGELRLDTSSNQRRFIQSDPFELSVGDRELVIEYSSPDATDAERVIRLFWGSDAFTLEPLPVNALFRDEPSQELSSVAVGHRLADSLRCAGCHDNSSGGIQAPPAPSLERVAGSRSTASLIRKLMDPQADNADSRMPHFDMSEDDAVAVAAYLIDRSNKALSEKTETPERGDSEAGHRLLKTTGCVACHRVGEFAPTTEYLAPDLTTVKDRRSDEWLSRWLRDPASLNPDHQMPQFKLSADERRRIVAALRAGFGGEETPLPDLSKPVELVDQSDDTLMARGKELITQARCASCHAIPDVERPATGVKVTMKLALDGARSCIAPASAVVSGSDEARFTPRYRLNDQQRASLVAWLDSATLPGARLSEFDHGKLLLHRNGCVSCHDRDNSRGISRLASRLIRGDNTLSGQSEALIPPSLTAVGDKLNDDYLNTAIFGKQQSPRLPWLLVQMPQFKHTEEEAAAIRHHLVATDRIPDSADDLRSDLIAAMNHGLSDKESLVTGNALVGAAGFNCVACHKAGPWEPRHVAMGTRGSDILSMNKRLRPRFFQRWMRGPVRIVPGMEMPTIRKGVPELLDGSLDKQLGVIWTALNDPEFKAPADVSSVEQLLIVSPDDGPRIVRDVFTMSEDSDSDPVARAFAVGFPNGHSVLFDLDRFSIRQWTVGEFARQRTEGKSWFWDMSGVPVAKVMPPEQTFRLITDESDPNGLTPLSDQQTDGRLIRYAVNSATDSVEFEYAIRFPTVRGATVRKKIRSDLMPLPPETFFEVRIRETWSPLQTESQTGWTRSLAALDLEPRHVLIVTMPLMTATYPAGVIAAPADVRDGPRVSGDNHNEVVLTARNPAIAWNFGTVLPTSTLQPKPRPPIIREVAAIDTIPGFKATRLPLDTSIMPTAMTWLDDGRLAFTSLRGHVWIASDTDGDGLEDHLSQFEEGLAAPFGILQDGDSLIVAQKPEVLRLRDVDGDGRADLREVVASGWGFTDNYHDWTSGLVRADNGDLFVGLGSDYSQKDRAENTRRWRGGIVRIQSGGRVEHIAAAMRYPMGLALDRKGRLFATDNQGVQNTFNEINHIIPGRAYGVPSRAEADLNPDHETPAIQVPHPWTRSVNALTFLPDDFAISEFAGQAIGCEYDTRCLIRLSFDDANHNAEQPDEHPLQGAAYRLSTPADEIVENNLVGPICIGVSPSGAIYIGNIFDSGWLGGRNTGSIAKLIPDPTALPVGISEVTATADGFRIAFCGELTDVLRERLANPETWDIKGYTRQWEGSYATPDSGQHRVSVAGCEWNNGRLHVKAGSARKAGHVYEIRAITTADQPLWPETGHYTMKTLPDDGGE